MPPVPDDARARLRATAGVGQLGYGVLKLRRTGGGWYHVVLGARQLVQARLGASGAFSPAADAAVDGIHVVSLLALAAVRPYRRREALLGAANGLAWALLDAALRRRTPPAADEAGTVARAGRGARMGRAGRARPAGRVTRTRA
jgi:hypothetical protein